MSKRVLTFSAAIVGILTIAGYGLVSSDPDFRVIAAIGLFVVCFINGALVLLSRSPPALAGASQTIVGACYWCSASIFGLLAIAALAGVDVSFLKDLSLQNLLKGPS